MRGQTWTVIAAALVWLTGVARARAEESVPAPKFERVRYEEPAKYTTILPTMGTKALIEKWAAEIPAGSFEQQLAGVRRWIDTHLRYEASAAYTWRPFDKMLADGTYGGCADHALAFGCLTRALGIPTVWVKTMDADWIRELRTLGESEITSWRGHVFLEVFASKRWLLLDATEGVLHEDYDVRSRVLPGQRFAYDKGGDPYELVLSTRWEEWKQQTRAHFKAFDLAQLPVAPGRAIRDDPVNTAYLAADNPGWTLLEARFKQLGWTVGSSGNVGFERWLPLARGKTLVVASVGGHEVLPADLRAKYLPKPFANLAQEPGRGDSWVLRRTLDDGTKLILVYGKDESSLASAISTLPPG